MCKSEMCSVILSSTTRIRTLSVVCGIFRPSSCWAEPVQSSRHLSSFECFSSTHYSILFSFCSLNLSVNYLVFCSVCDVVFFLFINQFPPQGLLKLNKASKGVIDVRFSTHTSYMDIKHNDCCSAEELNLIHFLCVICKGSCCLLMLWSWRCFWSVFSLEGTCRLTRVLVLIWRNKHL